MNLRGVDLNLLTVFEAVYEEQSQIKAAQRLGMTQPAVSNALARLRHQVGDRLFQGRAKGMVPTGRADELYQRLHPVLDTIRHELTSGSFDPATSQRTFVVSLSFGGGALVGLRLFRRFRESAPGVRLILRTIDPAEEIPGLLREQRLDLAVHHEPLDDSHLEQTRYFTYHPVVIARDGHPRVEQAVSHRDELLREEFVAVYDQARGISQNPALRPLLHLLRDRVALEVPSTTMLAPVVAQTDLLAVVSLRVAEFMGQAFGLRIRHYPIPFTIPEFSTYLIWHPLHRDDPGHLWLRRQCLAVAAELGEPPVDGGTAPGLAG